MLPLLRPLAVRGDHRGRFPLRTHPLVGVTVRVRVRVRIRVTVTVRVRVGVRVERAPR